MTALWIILGILAFLVILLFIPCRIDLQYHDGNFEAKFCYLFINIPLTNRKKKPKKEKKNRPAKKKASPEEEKPKSKPRSFMEYLELINDILPILSEEKQKFFGHIILRRCRVALVIAQEDAADTAIRFGRANALVHNIYALLTHYFRVKEFHTDIRQDYLSGPGAERADAELLFTFRLLAMLVAGPRLLFRGGRIALDFKNKKPLPTMKGSE